MASALCDLWMLFDASMYSSLELINVLWSCAKLNITHHELLNMAMQRLTIAGALHPCRAAAPATPPDTTRWMPKCCTVWSGACPQWTARRTQGTCCRPFRLTWLRCDPSSIFFSSFCAAPRIMPDGGFVSHAFVSHVLNPRCRTHLSPWSDREPPRTRGSGRPAQRSAHAVERWRQSTPPPLPRRRPHVDRQPTVVPRCVLFPTTTAAVPGTAPPDGAPP